MLHIDYTAVLIAAAAGFVTGAAWYSPFLFGRDRAIPALRSISLAVRSGELAALAAPSGSGKSTLLSLLGSIMPPPPTFTTGFPSTSTSSPRCT